MEGKHSFFNGKETISNLNTIKKRQRDNDNGSNVVTSEIDVSKMGIADEDIIEKRESCHDLNSTTSIIDVNCNQENTCYCNYNEDITNDTNSSHTFKRTKLFTKNEMAAELAKNENKMETQMLNINKKNNIIKNDILENTANNFILEKTLQVLPGIFWGNITSSDSPANALEVSSTLHSAHDTNNRTNANNKNIVVANLFYKQLGLYKNKNERHILKKKIQKKIHHKKLKESKNYKGYQSTALLKSNKAIDILQYKIKNKTLNHLIKQKMHNILLSCCNNGKNEHSCSFLINEVSSTLKKTVFNIMTYVVEDMNTGVVTIRMHNNALENNEEEDICSTEYHRSNSLLNRSATISDSQIPPIMHNNGTRLTENPIRYNEYSQHFGGIRTTSSRYYNNNTNNTNSYMRAQDSQGDQYNQRTHQHQGTQTPHRNSQDSYGQQSYLHYVSGRESIHNSYNSNIASSFMPYGLLNRDIYDDINGIDAHNNSLNYVQREERTRNNRRPFGVFDIQNTAIISQYHQTPFANNSEEENDYGLLSSDSEEELYTDDTSEVSFSKYPMSWSRIHRAQTDEMNHRVDEVVRNVVNRVGVRRNGDHNTRMNHIRTNEVIDLPRVYTLLDADDESQQNNSSRSHSTPRTPRRGNDVGRNRH